ncbi:Isochorismatase family protein [Klebsiella pneumoniae]|nr:Isochorismatase family protein [Klebsiella pneumoniae]
MSIRELLDPTNSALIFIDHQPQMSFGVANIDRQTLKNNTVERHNPLRYPGAPLRLDAVGNPSATGG